MEKKNNLHIEFEHNQKNLIPEFIVRIFVLIFIYWQIEIRQVEKGHQIFIFVLFCILNIISLILTIYSTGRRKKSIINFIEMRLKVDETYGNSNFQYSSNFSHSPYYFFVILASFLFFLPTLFFLEYLKGTSLSNYSTIIQLVLTVIYGLSFRVYRMNFISKGIKHITFNNKKFSEQEVTDFMSLLYDEKQESESYYVNDDLIFELERNANIYKQRVETLLIESVFIGALTFGTFIELTSPESIDAFRHIDEIEMKSSGLDLEALKKVKDSLDYRDIITQLKVVPEELLKTANEPNSTNTAQHGIHNRTYHQRNQLQNRNTQSQTDFKQIQNEIHTKMLQNFNLWWDNGKKEIIEKKNSQIQGIFQEWARQRHYNIFSYFYKERPRNYNDIPDIFTILKSRNNEEEKLKNDIDKLTYKIWQIRNSMLVANKVTIDSNIQENVVTTNLKVISEKKCAQLIELKDQLKLVEIYNENKNRIFTLSGHNRTEVLRILQKHNKDNFIKYYCMTKKGWDEQEYLFLVAIGSIICSVLYISVLIKRFVIILKIETLFSEINKALAWNRREEDALANEMRTRIEGSNELIHEEFKRKRKYYTEKLQIQLAKCTQIGSAIETNIQVASFLRNIGLYTFFIVLLIGTMMLDPQFTFVLSFILIYAMVGSAFMHEGSNIRSFWKQFSHKPMRQE